MNLWQENYRGVVLFFLVSHFRKYQISFDQLLVLLTLNIWLRVGEGFPEFFIVKLFPFVMNTGSSYLIHFGFQQNLTSNSPPTSVAAPYCVLISPTFKCWSSVLESILFFLVFFP